MNAAPTQTEAQRLAERVQDLSSMFKTPSHERGICNQCVDLLLRQDELLEQAEKALKTVAKELGIDWLRDEFFDANETMLAIRAHREAK